jgi:hypothetical protein
MAAMADFFVQKSMENTNRFESMEELDKWSIANYERLYDANIADRHVYQFNVPTVPEPYNSCGITATEYVNYMGAVTLGVFDWEGYYTDQGVGAVDWAYC